MKSLSLSLLVLIFGGILLFRAPPVLAADIQWRDDTFTKTTFEEDVKVILREILQRNGMEVFFRPGIEGDVTFEFSNLPLQAAFNKLREENGLAYSYDETTNTVTVFNAQSQAFIDKLFIPKNSSLEDIIRALERFGRLDGQVDIKADYKTGSLFLKGPQDLVSDLERLAGQIDEAYKSRKDAELVAWQRNLDKRSINQSLENSKTIVKVIPLRYASVGTSKTAFQGESVEIPGILESLKAFVGSIEVRDVTKTDADKKKPVVPGNKSNKPIVSIDQRTNSVIAQGSESQVARIESVIKELDKPVPLVEIEVMIVNGQANLSEQLGVRWGINQAVGPNANNVASAESVVSTGSTTQIALSGEEIQEASTTTVTDLGNVTTSSATNASIINSGVAQAAVTASGLGAGFIYQGTRMLLDATLSALASDDQLQTIASPRVVTLNNLQAKITNSSNINFVVTTGDGTKSGIETVSTGVTLEITPSVILDLQEKGVDMVRLDINAENSSLGAVSTSSVQTDEQEVQTNVIIPEGTTFVMGGLFNTSRVETESGVPGLKDLPLFGGMFRTRASSEQQRETVFFITPRVFRPEEIKMSLAARQIRAYVNAQGDKLDLTSEEIRAKSRLLDISQELSEDE